MSPCPPRNFDVINHALSPLAGRTGPERPDRSCPLRVVGINWDPWLFRLFSQHRGRSTADASLPYPRYVLLGIPGTCTTLLRARSSQTPRHLGLFGYACRLLLQLFHRKYYDGSLTVILYLGIEYKLLYTYSMSCGSSSVCSVQR